MKVVKNFVWNFKYLFIAVFVLVVFLIGGTYAWVNVEIFGSKTHVISSGSLVIELDESTCSGINLVNAFPTSDIDGMKQVACTFSIENTGTLDSGYSIYLDDLELSSGERINDSNIKYSLMKNASNSTGLVSDTGVNPNRILDEGVIGVGSTNNYELRFWIKEDASNDIIGKIFNTKLRVESVNYEIGGCEDLPSYGGIPNDPELVGDMIPVVYDGTNWVKAEINNINNSWYNYDEQMWANAVTVTEVNRATYVAATVGTTIPMEDINTFMVWIPRYSYTIKDTYGVRGCGGSTPSVETPGAFDIKFINSNTTDLGSAKYTSDTAENWYTNSAFCWGNSCDDVSTRYSPENRELSGIWVAKFEASYGDGVNLVSLPNVTSVRNFDVSSAFSVIKNYMNGSDGETVYGLSSSTYDVHMMKNTEWGAVAYLSQSRYGKYGNDDYLNVNKEIYQNKSSLYMTGYSNGTPGSNVMLEQCVYNDLIDRGNGSGSCGGGASTSGTVYGIYDMSGGALEYVMSNMKSTSNKFFSSDSGFLLGPDKKYYNIYNYNNYSYNFDDAILGDAIKEVAEFYYDQAYFNYGSFPWIIRGGHYATTGYTNGGLEAGIFYFSNRPGSDFIYIGFRFSVVP